MKRSRRQGGQKTPKRPKGNDGSDSPDPGKNTAMVTKTKRPPPPSVLARLLTEVPDMAVHVLTFLSPIDIYAVRRVNTTASGLGLSMIPPPEAAIPDGQPWGQFDQEVLFWLTEVARIRPGARPEQVVWALRRLYSQGLDMMFLDTDRVEQMVVALLTRRSAAVGGRTPPAPDGGSRRIVAPLRAAPDIRKAIRQLAVLNGQDNGDLLVTELETFWKNLDAEREAVRDAERRKPENQWTSVTPADGEGEA
ncbi:hypothetical protein [Nonomuraea sp. NPDC052265]|uniref:hypothetical protein n=1 Tax=Nonomuraea sp. NPDC052265 TaxID=3364374 RepID=UPI0037CB02B1